MPALFGPRTRVPGDLSRFTRATSDSVVLDLENLLRTSPDPAAALRYLDRLLDRQELWFHKLARQPVSLRCLVALAAQSPFLADQVIEKPHWIEEVAMSGELASSLAPGALRERLSAELGPMAGSVSPQQLALFRKRQLLRIVLRDVMGLAPVGETTADISALADAILDAAAGQLRAGLEARYGVPRLESGARCGFSVIALGKLGGEELNYSSDIDLLFVHGGPGETDGPAPVSNKEFYKKLAHLYTDLLSTYTVEGPCYRVDLRLRPEGKLGEAVISVEAAKDYYRSRARDWELQMMIKARPAAGDPEPARELLDFVEPLIYSTTLDFSAVEAVSEARARIHEQARAKRAAGKALDIKLTPGGIRDVEFCVQCLQRLHGGREPWVRHGGTLLALARLRDKELLSPAEYATLANAYQFLRHLEHRLQFAHDQQTHALPEDPQELEIVARRMPPIPGREAGRESLLRTLNAHLESVQQIYERVIHAQKPVYYNFLPPVRAAADLDPFLAAELPSNLVRFLDKLAPELAKLVAQGRPRRNPAQFEFLLEKAVSQERWLRLINDPVIAAFTLDIFETAPYLAEQLARSPAYLEELAAVKNASEASFRRPPRYEEAALEAGDPARLRQFYHREMFRIQAESLCLRRPVFETLARTSALADAVIAAAYQMAIWHVQGNRPPEDPAYFPQNQLLVIALGRLGVCEFDLGSDADLVFVLPDEDAAESAFWTRVAERLIECLSSYTPAGIVFSVDTRLRPNGKDSPLVQRASALLDYFQKSAEAWEGIAYMKARGVAGDPQQATGFLNQVQELDFRRYGQSGRSKKQLERMRMRLEKEQGAANPLKSGFGGYYDIDFALMYLRLRGAGIFFKTLNTPERIDIVEKMGHLDQPDARFLLDGATLYRAVDHGLRLLEGQAPGALPSSPVAREQLANMVERWTPDHLHDQPLELELAQIQSRTREYFERLFG